MHCIAYSILLVFPGTGHTLGTNPKFDESILVKQSNWTPNILRVSVIVEYGCKDAGDTA